jgi:DNA-binding transcriptional ArsR family regulator
MDDTRTVRDPLALRALAHPVRVRALSLLRTEGPLTATGLATRLALNTGVTSYHLRQLAQHGFIVEDATRGRGRERWWRAAQDSTWTSDAGLHDEAGRDAYDAFLQSVALVHSERLQRAVEERPLLPEQWRRATTLSDWVRKMTPGQAAELKQAMFEVMERWPKESDGADEEEDFVVVLQTYPLPGRVTVNPTGEGS